MNLTLSVDRVKTKSNSMDKVVSEQRELIMRGYNETFTENYHSSK